MAEDEYKKKMTTNFIAKALNYNVGTVTWKQKLAVTLSSTQSNVIWCCSHIWQLSSANWQLSNEILLTKIRKNFKNEALIRY